MLHLIESYQRDFVVTIEGRTFPASCLVEDDEGIRVLISEWPISGQVWSQAHAGGARMIAISGEADEWGAILTETFIEHREEHAPSKTYRIDRDQFLFFDHFPSFREVTTPTPAPEARSSGFVHLHAHSEFSALDGLSTIDEMVEAAVNDGQQALAVTDHGICAGHPVLQHAADKAGIQPIFGIEANLTDDRFRRGDKEKGDAKEVLYDYRHMILWAGNDEGLRNLWAMSTEANREGFYGRPRMDWDTLERHSEGVLASTACLRGPVAQRILNDDEEGARVNLARLLGIYGDRLYVEIQTNRLEEQRKVNEVLVRLAHEYGLPLIAASDSHYPTIDERETHRVWIASQTNKDLQEEAELFTGDSDYHIMTTAEVRNALSYLDDGIVTQAIANTAAVADRCEARIEGKSSAPVYSKADTHDEGVHRDVERLVDICMSNWHKTQGTGHSQAEYQARFEREMRLLIDKGFCGYFLMVSDYCRWAREHNILVGPGRGSGSGSLVAYLSEITGIDPIAADLMFERFLTEGRKALPDFDVDFPASKRAELTEYLVERYGEERVIRVGTHIRLKNKGVIRDLARVLKNQIDIHYPDIDKISQIIEEAEADKAGLGMDWGDLWDEHGEVLQPFRDKYPEMFDYADKLVGKLKTYGKHAAGLVISPDEVLTEMLPLRRPGKDDPDLVAEFDMENLEELGLVKFDLLTLRTLDTIQMCVDLVEETTGRRIDVDEWGEEYEDPQVWGEIADGHTLGIFQIETSSGTRETKRFQPHSLDELSDVITLVRPGPQRSGLAHTYFQRKWGQEAVTYLDERLEPILSKTYGAMIYQEQVMKTCMVLAGYDETEADGVRKILGKKQIEKVEEAGKQFKGPATEQGTDPEVAEIIWNQMAEFAKYSFNRSHAYGYAMLGYWTAWFKFHYPVQFLTAVLSTVDKNRIPEFITEARRMGYKVLPPDINLSGKGFRARQMEVRYGFDGVKGIGEAAVEAVCEGQPYSSFEDFMERKGDKANMGVVKTLARIGVFDTIEPNRKALESRLEWQTDGSADRCVFKDETVIKDHGLPCHFDWASEPPRISEKTGKELKQKPLPKRCTRACRNFTPPEEPDFGAEDYTRDEIMEREMELLGVHLTYTPFDNVPEWLWDPEEAGFPVMVGSEIMDAENGSVIITVATISRIRPHTSRTGKEMGFLGIFAVDADLDVTVFNTEWKKWRKDMEKGGLYLLHLNKNQRGYSLSYLTPL